MRFFEFAPGGDFKPPVPPKQKGNDPWGNDDRSKILQAVRQLLLAGNKVDWKVPGQMGHVVKATDDSVIMKRWGKPYSKIHYSLMMRDDLDDQYQILMVKPGYYKVVSSDNSWNLEEEEQLDELMFMGMSPCTKDCSGHQAGYDWSARHSNAHSASWSDSFNRGAAIKAAGF